MAGSTTAAAGPNCAGLFGQKKYEQAAQCFLSQSKRLGASSKLSKSKRWTKGRLLRNAATCFKRAANGSSPTRAAFLRERALRLWQGYLSKKLYENSARQRQAKLEVESLLRVIGYATLTIKVSGLAAKICVKEYRLQRCKTTARWVLKVRPGIVVIAARRGLISRQAKVTLAPGSQARRLLRFQVAATKPRKPRLSFATLRIRSIPSSAFVFVAGKQVGKTPLVQKVATKTQTIRFSKPCYREQTLTWKPGSSLQLSARLRRTPEFMKWQNSRKSSGANRAWGWTVLSLGIAGAAVGVLGSVMGSMAHGEAEGHKATYQKAKEQSVMNNAVAAYRQAAVQGNQWYTASYVGFGVGAVALGVGLWRISTIPSKHSSPCATTR